MQERVENLTEQVAQTWCPHCGVPDRFTLHPPARGPLTGTRRRECNHTDGWPTQPPFSRDDLERAFASITLDLLRKVTEDEGRAADAFAFLEPLIPKWADEAYQKYSA